MAWKYRYVYFLSYMLVFTRMFIWWEVVELKDGLLYSVLNEEHFEFIIFYR